MEIKTLPLASTLFGNTDTDIESQAGALDGQLLLSLRIIVIRENTKEPLAPKGFTLKEIWWNGQKMFKDAVPCDLFGQWVDLNTTTMAKGGQIKFKIHNPDPARFAFVAFLRVGS